MADYEYWRAALAGEKPKMYVDDPQCGFYRTAIREHLPLKNGQGSGWKRTGWEPVAIFMIGEQLTAVIGVSGEITGMAQQTMTGDKLNEIWTYCAGNPISEEEYRSVAERNEGWSDESFKGETK